MGFLDNPNLETHTFFCNSPIQLMFQIASVYVVFPNFCTEDVKKIG